MNIHLIYSRTAAQTGSFPNGDRVPHESPEQKDQRLEVRRRQILDAATVVFAEQGSERATIREVARQAGVADGTIYNYFADKSDLLLGLVERVCERESGAQPSLPATADLRGLCKVLARHRAGASWPDTELFRAVLPALITQPSLRALYFDAVVARRLGDVEPLLEALRLSGGMRDVDSGLAARALSATFIGLLVMDLLGDDEIARRSDELPEVIVQMFSEGLAAN